MSGALLPHFAIQPTIFRSVKNLGDPGTRPGRPCPYAVLAYLYDDRVIISGVGPEHVSRGQACYRLYFDAADWSSIERITREALPILDELYYRGERGNWRANMATRR